VPQSLGSCLSNLSEARSHTHKEKDAKNCRQSHNQATIVRHVALARFALCIELAARFEAGPHTRSSREN
jgi:hypothetical protein